MFVTGRTLGRSLKTSGDPGEEIEKFKVIGDCDEKQRGQDSHHQRRTSMVETLRRPRGETVK